jgi:ribosomal protein S18 acetylase RimI-like enzyme
VEGLKVHKAHATDSEFVFAVKKAAFREYVEQIWGWDDTYQRDLHNRRFASQDLRIIQFHGTDVGFLSTSNTSDTFKINQLYILPEYQGRGIGAACMKCIIDDASLEQKPVTLQVLKINTRATAFYQRLGFTIVDENSTHFQMKRLGN